MVNNSSAASIYTDFSGLAQMRADARDGGQESKRAVAAQIEAMFIGMMLKSMRAGSDALGGAGANMPRDLYDSQIAQHLAQGGRLGFAEMMLQELNPQTAQTAVAASARPAAEALPAPDRNMLLARAVWDQDSLATPAASTVTGTAFKPTAASAAKESAPPASWSSPDEFVRELMPAARQAAEALGTRPEAVLAVAALETGWGKHMPRSAEGTTSNNLFGIKAHGWKGGVTRSSTLEFESGQFQRKVEPFRSYNSPQEAIADFADFLATQPRYKPALAQASDPEAFLRGLHKAGYATDPRYGDKLVAILNSAHLRAPELAASANPVSNPG